MWARTAEVMIGAWLMMSPLVFRSTPGIEHFVWRDIGAGVAVVVFSLLSFWRRTAGAHLLTVGLAAVLALAAYAGWERPGPPAAQNEITVALLLILLAIVPNEASQPPVPWRERP